MQEWTNSGTPVPAIGEAQVLLGTPLVGWGGTIEAPPAPPVVTEVYQRSVSRVVGMYPPHLFKRIVCACLFAKVLSSACRQE
jgi:hypothetical protein